jgi:hypothetical protein
MKTQFVKLSIMIILGLVFLSSDTYSQNSSTSKGRIEKLLIGKWRLINDKHFVMKITMDSIFYLYKNKLQEKDKVIFLVGDSCEKYRIGKMDYHFMDKNGTIHPQLIIKEINVDTVNTEIVSLTNKALYISSRGRVPIYIRIKNN